MEGRLKINEDITLVAQVNKNILSNKDEINLYVLINDGDTIKAVLPEISKNKGFSGVDNYIKTGRVGIMKYVRPHHIIKLLTQLSG